MNYKSEESVNEFKSFFDDVAMVGITPRYLS
jgi:hypothetical protein